MGEGILKVELKSFHRIFFKSKTNTWCTMIVSLNSRINTEGRLIEMEQILKASSDWSF